MKKESILVGIIGLLAGLLIAGATAVLAVNNDNHSVMGVMGMNTNHTHQQKAPAGDDTSMRAMTERLKNKTGDDFDKAFIEEMIMHHQGAIDMARLAETRAKHSEIKQLSQDILSAQSKEIEMMRGWQTDWGYTAKPHNMHGM
ncbi:MAG TPA: DUF305 domain-containing protein [Candidatus Saccharimonadales bacterium]